MYSGIDAEIVDLGFSKLDPDTGEQLVQGEAMLGSTFDDTPVYSQLGFCAMPWPADDDGSAQGVVLKGLSGLDGCCVGANDTRVGKKVFGEMAPGEACMFATGKDFESRIFCKKRSVVIVVSNDAVVVFDREQEKFQVAIAGHIIESSKENGISLAESGGAAVILKDGNLTLKGKTVFIGENPSTAVGLPGGAGSKSVWVPAT